MDRGGRAPGSAPEAGRPRRRCAAHTTPYDLVLSGDLANLDALDRTDAAKLAATRRLRDAIYSAEFKQFIRDITGCGELSETADLSCNVYAQASKKRVVGGGEE